MKFLILIIGAIIGGSGVGVWLLSDDGKETPLSLSALPDTLQARVQVAQSRFREALTEGKRAGKESEQQTQLLLARLRSGAQS